MTTSDYLTQLQQDREDLVDNLETKGITGLTGDETFTELVPEVLNIPSGEDLSDYFESTISSGVSYNEGGWEKILKKLPDNLSISGTNMTYMFSSYQGELPKKETFDTSNVTNMDYAFLGITQTTIPQYNTSNVTSMSYCCQNCKNLVEAPFWDTSKVKEMNGFLSGDSNLVTVPQYNLQSVTNLYQAFISCPNLSDMSLDNILQMCININPNYSKAKTLAELGLTSANYPTSRIEALPHYQDFIDAGWTIGY